MNLLRRRAEKKREKIGLRFSHYDTRIRELVASPVEVLCGGARQGTFEDLHEPTLESEPRSGARRLFYEPVRHDNLHSALSRQIQQVRCYASEKMKHFTALA